MRRGLAADCAARRRTHSSEASPAAAVAVKKSRRDGPFMGEKYDEGALGCQERGLLYTTLARRANEICGVDGGRMRCRVGTGWGRSVSESVLDLSPGGEQHVGAAAGSTAEPAGGDDSGGARKRKNASAGFATESGGTEAGGELFGRHGTSAKDSGFGFLQ